MRQVGLADSSGEGQPSFVVVLACLNEGVEASLRGVLACHSTVEEWVGSSVGEQASLTEVVPVCLNGEEEERNWQVA